MRSQRGEPDYRCVFFEMLGLCVFNPLPFFLSISLYSCGQLCKECISHQIVCVHVPFITAARLFSSLPFMIHTHHLLCRAFVWLCLRLPMTWQSFFILLPPALCLHRSSATMGFGYINACWNVHSSLCDPRCGIFWRILSGSSVNLVIGNLIATVHRAS